MAFWIVYHGKDWNRARRGGYLWAPKRGRNGQTQAYWATMERVRPGDLIFSGANSALRAVAEATLPAYSAERPDPMDNQFRYGNGWRLDITFTDLLQPMYYRDWVPDVLGEMPALHSPFQSGGGPNQGYLYELPNSVGEHIIHLARQQGVDLAGQANEVAPVPDGAETTRQQIVAARMGQGNFRKDLLIWWEGSCAILGTNRPELLRASHIKPWSSSNNVERLDPANGLLLSAMYDAAFDALLLSFAEDGALMLAQDFSTEEAATAGIDSTARIKIKDPKTASYLAEHRALMAARSTRSVALSKLAEDHVNASIHNNKMKHKNAQ
ncbi:MAG TPA: HNH endonuclease signature motif containing protein [Acidisoma sp.]|uniref:HNH endonuclease signature motif containing protein n=1 Tax=Acidisoma sp. TaxID=1872115 RepID=UPI002B989115|nr:HNH endonuclease signature motif containing protein [Acidisoma sp.]HTI02610.1 HNH endonuclease signature motif containing protein [Acidisoma sp.]